MLEGRWVVKGSELAEAERRAVAERDATEGAFMDRAAAGIYHVAKAMLDRFSLGERLVLVCGKGNNAGDAYSVGTLFLKERGQAVAFQLFPWEVCSDLCRERAENFMRAGGRVVEVKEARDLNLAEGELIVDGIFGTGFKGKTEGIVKEAIDAVNGSKNRVLAVDIPSGISGDTGRAEGSCIHADATVCLGLVKVGNLYNDGYENLGELHSVDFGLGKKYVESMDPWGFLVNEKAIWDHLPKRKRKANKYSVGKVAIVGGSHEMPGACILAAVGALRSGAGIVQLFHAPGMSLELSLLPVEVLRGEIEPSRMELLAKEMPRVKGLLIGPGLGRGEQVPKLLDEVFKMVTCPIVIDGDALYFYKKGFNVPAVLTPHRGELIRLLGAEKDILDLELLELAEAFARKEGVTVVCKGAPTTIVFPRRKKMIIALGNEGMASGGMGDVLAGIIVSLIAQGKDVEEAAILGATVHALAGDKAREKKSIHAMIASDLVSELPSIFAH